MDSRQLQHATDAATTAATSLGLAVDDAVILNDSNRLVVRLTPCDTVARVTPTTHHAGHQVSPEREVDVVQQLARTDSPVAVLDPRVAPRGFVRDSFTITFWTHYASTPSPSIPSAEYAAALERLHAGLRRAELTSVSVMDRVAAVRHDVADRTMTPDLAVADRDFLSGVLREFSETIVSRQVPQQLLHGEPHSGNLLSTTDGPLFIDFENTAHGPVEYDLGWVPRRVGDDYPGVDQDLVDTCRGLVIAMVATYRWRRDDRHPSGRASGVAFLDALRAGPPWPALDDISW